MTSFKTAPSKLELGNPIDYTVSIINTGEVSAENAVMLDPIPAGTVYNGDVACSSGTCYYDGTEIVWYGEVGIPPRAGASYTPAAGALPVSGAAIQPEAQGSPKAVPEFANPEAVLWDQYSNYTGTNSSQDNAETLMFAYYVMHDHYCRELRECRRLER